MLVLQNCQRCKFGRSCLKQESEYFITRGRFLTVSSPQPNPVIQSSQTLNPLLQYEERREKEREGEGEVGEREGQRKGRKGEGRRERESKS